MPRSSVKRRRVWVVITWAKRRLGAIAGRTAKLPTTEQVPSKLPPATQHRVCRAKCPYGPFGVIPDTRFKNIDAAPSQQETTATAIFPRPLAHHQRRSCCSYTAHLFLSFLLAAAVLSSTGLCPVWPRTAMSLPRFRPRRLLVQNVTLKRRLRNLKELNVGMENERTFVQQELQRALFRMQEQELPQVCCVQVFVESYQRYQTEHPRLSGDPASCEATIRRNVTLCWHRTHLDASRLHPERLLGSPCRRWRTLWVSTTARTLPPWEDVTAPRTQIQQKCKKARCIPHTPVPHLHT